MKVTIERFGKDHWSTFGYLASCVVGNEGHINRDKMRTDHDLHPGLAGAYCKAFGTKSCKYPTRLRGGELQDHDDWSCFEDLQEAGLVNWEGTGINPTVSLTPQGWEMARKLSEFKAAGGNFGDFQP